MNVIIIKFYIHLFHFNRCLNKLAFEAGLKNNCQPTLGSSIIGKAHCLYV